MGNRLPMTLSISCSRILLAYHLLMENTELPKAVVQIIIHT
ncbi:hypothetical protein T06_1494 [Trichinella sp. T6]|nr:hypothetical protein T06_1494 [Trichinella sp. T6]